MVYNRVGWTQTYKIGENYYGYAYTVLETKTISFIELPIAEDGLKRFQS